MPHRTKTFLPLYIAVFIVVLIALGVAGFSQTNRSNTNSSSGTTLDVSDISVENLNESLDEIEDLEADLIAPELDATIDLE